MPEVAITPLCVGTGNREYANFLVGAAPRRFDIPFVMYHVRVPGHQIIVDTGVTAPSETLPHHFPMAQAPGQTPAEALENIGVGVDEIDIVINTHLHWDHCANNSLFTNARVYAQRQELQYAMAPLPCHQHGYDSLDVVPGEVTYLPPFLRSKLELIDGDVSVCPEICILATPGHTPGSQSVLVRGEKNYVIAGDNVPLFDNLPGEASSNFTPNPWYNDLGTYYKSLKRCDLLADQILPSHDNRVFDQEVYR